jgi:2-polyprenyl-3-methyl-5-hydroxy-6-metoxy-1,4-benzoquinol methylase
MRPPRADPSRACSERVTPDRYFEPGEFRARDIWEERHYWHRYRRRVILETLRRVTPRRDARLIEVGCGVGTVSTYLNENGCWIDYADVHQEALERAQRRARERLGASADRHRFLRLDVTQEAPPPEYEGVLLLDVLEHLPDDLGVLRRLRRGLAERGGFLLVTVPAFPALWSRWDVAELHKRRYVRRQLCDLAETAGLRVERATYFFLPLFLPALAAALARSLERSDDDRLAAVDPTSLAEFRHGLWLNRVMPPFLAPERWWLRRGNVPFGTSLLIVARAG